ncbi:unnamed protein product [Strongylus vulgaris]|uniref:Uncharacterized protein n=1 Tax=Strongylus vulgaris TaxID=40348 RepID=A0A3P7K949_STRVU|nr:unnamed protein product [Strongylus vulgaris]
MLSILTPVTFSCIIASPLLRKVLIGLAIICGGTFRPLPFRVVNIDDDIDKVGTKPDTKRAKKSAMCTDEGRSLPHAVIKEARTLTNSLATDDECGYLFKNGFKNG